MDRSPRFTLEFDLNSGKIKIDKNQFIYPQPLITNNDNLLLLIFGSPILDSKINKNKITKDIFNEGNLDKDYIKLLDGEFLFILIDKNLKTIEVSNDRFASFIIYYFFNDNKVFLSHAYIDIIEKISSLPNFALQQDVLFEYLWFRRVFDNRTFDNYSKYLKPARIIHFKQEEIKEISYWSPKFNKNNNSLSKNSTILKNLLTSALNKKISDISTQKIGLFLSGGMDTRTILSVFKHSILTKIPHCFTIGYTEKGEYRVAKKLTNKIDISHRHSFIKLEQNFTDLHWNEKLNMTGGMHNQYTILFSGYSQEIEENADIFFHGHGLDYMFQGMYLPTKLYKIFGKKTHFKKVMDINDIDNFSKYFMNNVPFRTWRVKVDNYILPQYRESMIHILENKIDLIVKEGKGVCKDNFDLWEYLMIHTPSRHYSQPDIIGIGAHGEQRKIANDNALFNFYTSLPLDHRLYARIMRGALRKLSPEFAKIISANTDYKIDSGPLWLTLYFAKIKFLRWVTNNNKYRHPQAKDRTWPNLDDEIRIRPRLRAAIIQLPNSKQLRNAMPFFDFNKLESDIDQWLNHDKPNGGLFLTSLLTLDNLAKRIQ